MRPTIDDEGWSTKDELERYRAILGIHGRERDLRSRDAANLKKRTSRRFGALREDVDRYRRIASDVATGRTRASLQGRRRSRLECRGRRTAEEIYASLWEDGDRRRRRLDKLRYEKRRRMKRCFELQLEHAELCDDYARERRVPWALCGTRQRRLVTRCRRFVAKRDAAKAINLTYASMLEILKKDAVRRETVLDALKRDRKGRCEVMLKATIMGQLAVEESDDVGQRCERVTRRVWNDLKERERALTFVRDRVDDLWSYARSLIRTESEAATFSMEVTRAATVSNARLDERIRSLEEVFGEVEESLLVRSYRELLSRLDEQMKRRTRLLDQFDRNVEQRESLLNRKNDALAALSDVERTLLAAVEEYNADRNVLLERIAIQKKRELDYNDSRKDRGRLLMDVGATLRNVAAMLLCVGRGGRPPPSEKRARRLADRRRTTTRDGKDDTDEREEKISGIDVLPTVAVETDGLALLSSVSRKIGALFGMSNFEFDADREERARDLYQTYVSDYRSELKFADAESEPTGLYVEREAIDSTVPTRADVKIGSERAVEARSRLD